MNKLQEILRSHWGFSSFRPLQQDIIEHVLEHRDVISLLPTGGGKSLCYQVPALAMPGICIVISPLVALMEDQVGNLKARGIKAMALIGGLPPAELDILLDNCIYGNYKFLYLSPERLKNDLVQERILKMPVNLIAVDEAHCISQWGHDFRPAYRDISQLRDWKPAVPFIALTATATNEVIADIRDQLKLESPLILKKSFNRDNIAYKVIDTEDKKNTLVKTLTRERGSAIVYVNSRKGTLELCRLLERSGISATPFHGGLNPKEKSSHLQQWLKSTSSVMVATSAFGMGIDKADVRIVAHMDLPDSLEGYFQQSGRAGRDGKPAAAVVLHHTSDFSQLREQFLGRLPSVRLVKLVYKKLMAYLGIAYGEGQDSEYGFNFPEFCKHYSLPLVQAYQAVLLLDRTSVLQLTESNQKKNHIRLKVSPGQLKMFLISRPEMEPVMSSLLRSYGGLFEKEVEINLELLSKKIGVSIADMERVLQELKKSDLAEIKNDQHDFRIVFLVPREDDITINPLVPYITRQIQTKKKKISEVIQYLSNDSLCRNQQLLRYFGESETEPCGRCSVCVAQEPPLNQQQFHKIGKELLQTLRKQEKTKEELEEALPFPKGQIQKVLRILMDRRKIKRSDQNTYKIYQI